MKQIPIVSWFAACLLFHALSAGAAEPAANPEAEKHFESKIRPLLVKHCQECHGSEKQQGDVRLDHRAAVFAEGHELIVPGKPDESRILQVIQYSDYDTQMPPAGKLPADVIETLTAWIRDGAYWPAEPAPEVANQNEGGLPRRPDGTIDFERAAASHWAYRPIANPPVPSTDHDTWSRGTIDQFILAKLSSVSLSPSEPADRPTLIRRVYFDMLGVPPTYNEVDAFVQDASPTAYEDLIDRVLASPLYGQRWGRHWLDLARYADTKGYVFTENRFYPYAYTYRDYVVASLNEDAPYDRFVTEQLAADHLDLPEKSPALAGLGFLTVGPRFRNSQADIIDDRIDVVTRGLLGMTVGCARCHDHKYDPVPTADYYSLYGVFASCYEPELPPLVGEVDTTTAEYQEFAAELKKREEKLNAYVDKAHNELLDILKDHAKDYLQAVTTRVGKLPEGVEPTYEHDPPRDRLIRRWQAVLDQWTKRKDPNVLLWSRLSRLAAQDFSTKWSQVVDEAENAGAHPAFVAALRAAEPSNILDVARIYGDILKQASGAQSDLAPLRAVLEGPGSVTDVQASAKSPLFERDHRNQIRKLQREIDKWRVESPAAPPRAMALLDKERPVEPVIFVRGNPGRRGDRVPRRMPRILSPETEVFRDGSGRLALAEEICHEENPLTARVFVNRVWMHHFGVGLVDTPSDFGLRGSAPSHPKLLDHLAHRFMHQQDWSIKGLHRDILLSATYRQSSLDRPECRQVDPENRLLWKMNRRRLEFEAMRDALLAVSGILDSSLGGRPVDLEKAPYSRRRTVYGLIDRNNLPGLLRTFDFPSPDASSPQRPTTTVPQQTLFSLNSPFVEMVADTLARQVGEAATAPEDRVDTLFRTVLSRNPAPEERESAIEFLSASPRGLPILTQALLMTNEFHFVD